VRSQTIVGIALLLLALATAAVILRPVLDAAPSQTLTAREDTMGLGSSAPPDSQGIRVHVGSPYPAMTTSPTSDSVQSKLWFNDGTWWGLLATSSTGAFHIHRLDPELAAWRDTGVVVDERSAARADVLWDGEKLYVASGGTSPNDALPVRFTRFSYDPAESRYSLDGRFPVELTDAGARSLTIAKDSDSVVWVAYISGGQIWMNRTVGSDSVWAEPFPLPGTETSAPAVASSVIAYGDRVGVIWASQADGTVSLVTHRDGEHAGTWDPPTLLLDGDLSADNHLSARSLDGAAGTTLFVAAKTSHDVLPDQGVGDAQVLLLEIRPDGEVVSHVYGRLEDRHTRPLLVIDEEARELIVLAVSPFGSGSVYYKRASADDVEFAPGRGAPFLHVPERPSITDPTSTKQNLDASTDLVVLAADRETSHYLHGVLALGATPLP
jgi:hypothetical protein